jgi:DNA-binding transcriptional ArsR family regulator
MSKTTTRRLFAVVVAILVGCSVAGGPAIAVAAATGTDGADVDGTLGSEDGPSDGPTSDGDSSDEGASDDTNRDESGDDASSENDSSDGSDDESTDDSSTNDSSTDERSDEAAASVPPAARAADHNANAALTVDGVGNTDGNTVSAETVTGFTLAETVGTTLNLSLDLPDDGLRRTELTGSVAAEERVGAGPTGAAGGDGDSVDAMVTTVGALGDGAGLAGGDGARPIPGGLTGGATLGLSALAAVAFVRSPVLGGGSGAGLLGTLLGKLRPFVLPLRYSRYDDSDPLEHEAREVVYEVVHETPGSYLSEVSERAGLPLSTTRHHMKVLEREELVSGAKLRGKRRFYPAYAEGIELAAALNDESTASIIDALARLGAASVSDLADDLGRDPSTISHHLQRLEGDDIITRERQGRAVVNKLSSDARTALQPETTPRPGEAAEALAD